MLQDVVIACRSGNAETLCHLSCRNILVSFVLDHREYSYLLEEYIATLGYAERIILSLLKLVNYKDSIADDGTSVK